MISPITFKVQERVYVDEGVTFKGVGGVEMSMCYLHVL